MTIQIYAGMSPHWNWFIRGRLTRSSGWIGRMLQEIVEWGDETAPNYISCTAPQHNRLLFSTELVPGLVDSVSHSQEQNDILK